MSKQETKVLKFDGEVAKMLEQWYLSPDVEIQRQFILNNVAPQPGEHILDIGSGPGLLARDLATAVGSHGLVYGIDISDYMVKSSQDRCRELPWAKFEIGNACELVHPEKGLFDCIISTQVYEYVQDIEKALNEAYRMLKPGGRIVVLDTDFDSVVWHTSDRNRMQKMLTAYDEHLIHPHLPQFLGKAMKQAGFTNITTKVHCICNSELSEDTYSYGLLTTIAKFVSERESKLSNEEILAWKQEQLDLNKTGSYFFSLNRYLFVATR